MARKRTTKTQATQATPSSTPPPPTPSTSHIVKRPPWPLLASFVPPDLARKGWHSRHMAMRQFLIEKGGDGKYNALVQHLMMTWPTRFVEAVDVNAKRFIPGVGWNPWLERLLRAFTNEKYAIRQGDRVIRTISLTGCASASKSHVTSLFAVAWWMICPDDSIAVLTSTTKDMLRSRVWSVVKDYATSAIDAQTGEDIEVGHLVDSQMKLLPPDSKNAKHSVAAYAVAHGETAKAVDNLKGLHAPRMLVVIDEANSTPEAIFNVIPNYKKGCRDLTIIVVGNPSSRLDAHGRACKPADGWPLAMDEKVIEWRTEGVKEWELDPGVCLRFDGRDSPNVRLKRNAYPYLYLHEDWLAAEEKRQLYGGDMSYWSMSRGMWPADGASNTVFNEQLLIRCDAIGTHFTFETERNTIAFLDPAFGSDACILQFAEMGDVGGRKCIQLTEWIDVPIDPTAAAHDRDYQVARWVMQTCITRRIRPEWFGLDATGTGRGVGAILASEWSPKINYTVWGQGATDRASAQNDGRPAKEVYSTFVGELWFAARELLEAGQIRGFSRESIGEFCSRQFEMTGKKYKLETKEDMRLRLRYSPDHADAVVGVIEVARRLGLEIHGKMAQNAQREWDKEARVLDAIYGEGASKVEASDGGWAEQDVHGDAVSVESDVVWD